MVNLTCPLCGAGFQRKPSQVLYGNGKYCSTSCQHRGRRKGKTVACTQCGKETYHRLRELNSTKSGELFCTRECSIQWLKPRQQKEKHPNWINGIYSYRYILERTKRKKLCELCFTGEEIVLAVHHIDHNRKNNVSKNLAWLCYNCHFLIHHYKGEKQHWLDIRQKDD